MDDAAVPSLLDRCRAIDLMYVRDLMPDEVGLLDEADESELLGDEEVAVGRFGTEWLAIVWTGHRVLAEFARRPTLADALAARDLHLERLDLTPAGSASQR